MVSKTFEKDEKISSLRFGERIILKKSSYFIKMFLRYFFNRNSFLIYLILCAWFILSPAHYWPILESHKRQSNTL